MATNHDFINQLAGTAGITPDVVNDIENLPNETTPIVCPVLPEVAYDYLTQMGIFNNVLAPVLFNPEQFAKKARDILLLSALARLSALMFPVRINYGNQIYSINIAVITVAESGSGKAVMKYAKAITRKVQGRLDDKNAREQLDYEEQEAAWKIELDTAKKEGRTPNFDLKPGDKPGYMLINMPATTSKSQLELALNDNRRYGTVLSSTEIGSLVSALGKDCGGFIDVICKALANEPVEHYYKVDGKPITTEFPLLSVELSGVEQHFHRLFQNLTDGGFNRFLCCVGDPNTGFRSQKPNYEKNGYKEELDRVAEECLALWDFMGKLKELEVVFTDEQWERHTARWTDNSDEFILSFETSERGVVNRHGLAQMRVAALFTVLEEWEKHRAEFTADDFEPAADTLRWTCSDTAFDMAEQIVGTFYEHALTLATTKKKEQLRGVREMSNWRWYYPVLGALDTAERKTTGFTREEFFAEVQRQKIGRKKSAIYNALNTLHKRSLLRKGKKGKFFKFTRELRRLIKEYVPAAPGHDHK